MSDRVKWFKMLIKAILAFLFVWLLFVAKDIVLSSFEEKRQIQEVTSPKDE